MYKPSLNLGAFFAVLAVILGAFGAHALKNILPDDQLKIFETGVRYQFYHSFALIITGILYQFIPVKQFKIAALLFLIGILFFSGSLYAMSILTSKGISIGMAGIITPIGGLFFIAGWCYFLLGINSKK